MVVNDAMSGQEVYCVWWRTWTVLWSDEHLCVEWCAVWGQPLCILVYGRFVLMVLC